MRIAICDDEPVFSEKLQNILQQEFGNHHIECEFVIVLNGEELISLCQNRRIDVVFLDIMMPGIDGYATAERLRRIHKEIMIVFISSNKAEFCKSFEYSPIWFVPKDQMTWIKWAVRKIIEKYKEYDDSQSYVKLKIGNIEIELDVRNIKYFKTEGHYVRYKCCDGTESISYRCKLSDVESQLNAYWFVKTHNRYLVNLRVVRSISEKTLQCYDGEEISISRNHKNEVQDKFQDYLRSIR